MVSISTNTNVSTKRTITSHLKIIELIIDKTYEVGNPVAGLGQAQTYGGVKQINGIPNPSYLIIAYPTAIHLYCSLS